MAAPVWHFVNGVPQVGPLTIGPAAVTSTVPGQFTALGVGVANTVAPSIEIDNATTKLRATSTTFAFLNTAANAYRAGRIDALSLKLYGADGSAGIDIDATGQVSAPSVRGTAVAFASVPATPVEGMLVTVTDSNTATWGATIAAGGVSRVLAYYNGANWTVAGK